MKTKIALTTLISIILISATNTHQSQEIEFQLQTEKQKIAIEEMTLIAIALADFITDPNEFPQQEGSFEENSKLYKALCPYYMESLPTEDPWDNDYLIFCGASGNDQYSISECENYDFVVVSLGKDGKRESWEYNRSDPTAGMFKVKEQSDFNKDLINWSGSWIRAPEELLEEISR